MFKVLAVLLASVCICNAAYAEDIDNCLGFSYSPDIADDIWRCSPIDTAIPIHYYFYLANSTLTTLSGFEFAWFADPPFGAHSIVLEVNVLGTENHTDDPYNFIIRLDTPVPTVDHTVLVDVVIFHILSPLHEVFYVGPTEPAEIPGSPAIIDGSAPFVVVPTNFPASAYLEPNGFAMLGGIRICPAVEATRWSTIKALYGP